ncbi:hypothetical protein ACS0PU_001172 [Formica fusca]
MAALSLALPFSAVLYLLPSVPNLSSDLGKVATKVATVNEQLNDFVGIIDVPKEIRRNNGKDKLEQSYGNGGSLYPLGIIKPVIGSVNDATRLDVGFQAKVESKKHPDHAGISTNIQLAKQAEWSHDVLSDEHKELSTEEKRINSLRAFKNGNTKDANIFHLYVPDITNALVEKFAKANTQLGSGVVSRDVDEKNNADNRAKKKNNYIRLCRRSIDGSMTSLMQKLRGKDCVKLPRSEFYLEQDTKDTNRKKGTIKVVGLKIGTKTNNEKDYKDSESGSDEYKQENEATENSIVDASISDDSINYEKLTPKVIDKLGMGLNIKKPVINGKIGKLALSTTLKL